MAERETVLAPVSAAAVELRPPMHLCCLYESEGEYRQLLAEVLRAAVERREVRVFFLTDERREAAAVEAAPEPWRSSKLAQRSAQEFFAVRAADDSAHLLAAVRGALAGARAEGLQLWLIQDLAWAGRTDGYSEKLIEYEALLNELLREFGGVSVCLYDRRVFSPQALLAALDTHTDVWVGGARFDNQLYYKPAAEYLSQNEPKYRLARRLERLRQQQECQLGLSRHASRWRGMFDYLDAGVAICQAVDAGEDFLLLDVNPAFARDEQLARERLVGRRHGEVFPGPRGEVLRQAWRWTLRQGVAQTQPLRSGSPQSRLRTCTFIPLGGGEILTISAGKSDLRTFSAGLSHNLNNLNTGLMGYLNLVLGDGRLPADLCQRLELARRSARRLSELCQLISVYSLRSAPAEVCDLQALVRTGVAEVWEEFIRQDVVLLVRDEPAGEVLVDRGAVLRAVRQLLDNAREAVLGQARREVTVSCGGEEQRCWLRIADNGYGVSPEDLGRIFDPFFTRKGEFADNDPQRAQCRGEGLGLSICQALVGDSGGELSVVSQPNQGATFTVRFPRCGAGEGVPAAENSAILERVGKRAEGADHEGR